jgi:hypothetical protein
MCWDPATHPEKLTSTVNIVSMQRTSPDALRSDFINDPWPADDGMQ